MDNERKHPFTLTEEALENFPNLFPVADKASAVGTEVMLTETEARMVGILPKEEAGASDNGSGESSGNVASGAAASKDAVCPRCGFDLTAEKAAGTA